VELTTREGLAQDEALGLAAAVEHDSEHTIAQGIVRSAEERGVAIPRAERFRAIPGVGVQAVVGGRELLLGGPTLLRRLNAVVEQKLHAAVENAAARGQASICRSRKLELNAFSGKIVGVKIKHTRAESRRGKLMVREKVARL